MTGFQSTMKRLKAISGSPLSQIIQPGNATFAMVEKVALHNLDKLMQEDMQAARLVMSLIRLGLLMRTTVSQKRRKLMIW